MSFSLNYLYIAQLIDGSTSSIGALAKEMLSFGISASSLTVRAEFCLKVARYSAALIAGRLASSKSSCSLSHINLSKSLTLKVEFVPFSSLFNHENSLLAGLC
ncbi:hypothetical protein E3U36_01495 [Arsenophonus endosymbiont of Aphis craccivora]|uniref:hypothetical protein n=1 Tax=Arsenophonus endosymbiont of Aphis craccivora TaxID=1231049 RepID=UPI0015DC4AC3|nr:hypothetical protein [Arsenophonus endosymbiont of Aphis craccivora]QLK87179.1 hypothetical protein E3U36_01495 [Arsenophonus endosymbiont of Aphis craccivora]